jgi:DNA-binding PadR family transcriptional regulator
VKTNPGRLLVLGVLATQGPVHGHRIRRMVELANVQEWGEVRPGALYGMLHRLEAEGLIESVRSEREGNRPPRTVYAITAEGRLELHRLREAAFTEIGLGGAQIDVALHYAPGDDAEALRELLDVRRKRLALLLDELQAHRRRDELLPGFPKAGSLTFRHHEIRLEAELRWHEELDRALTEVLEDLRARPWPPPEEPGEDVVELRPRSRKRTA